MSRTCEPHFVHNVSLKFCCDVSRGILVTRRGDETDADFDRHCCDLVRTESRNFRIHPMAALTALSASGVTPDLGSVRAQGNLGPSTTLDSINGLSIAT